MARGVDTIREHLWPEADWRGRARTTPKCVPYPYGFDVCSLSLQAPAEDFMTSDVQHDLVYAYAHWGPPHSRLVEHYVTMKGEELR